MLYGTGDVKQPFWRTFLYRTGLVIGMLLLVYQLYRSKDGFNQAELNASNWVWLALAITCLLLALGIQIAAWIALMRSIGLSLPKRSAFGHYYLSFISRYIPGSVWGYLSRAEWLKTDHGISYRQTNMGSFIEICAGLVSIVLMAALRFALTNKTGMIFGLCVIFLFPVVVVEIIRKTAGTLDPTRDRWGLSSLQNLRMKEFLAGTFLLTANWILYGSALLLSARFLGFDLPSSPQLILGIYPGIYSLAWLVGFLIIFLPSGVGAREIVLADGLVIAGLLQYPEASAVALILRGILLVSELIWLMISVAYSAARHSMPKRS
jgi:uncharacterized membrane protein YbhN (UPF0104 family)